MTVDDHVRLAIGNLVIEAAALRAALDAAKAEQLVAPLPDPATPGAPAVSSHQESAPPCP